MKILITGGTGFVGKPLIQKFISNGLSVVAPIRTIDGGLLNLESVEFIHIRDLTPTMDWYHALKDVDVVVHLAARVHELNCDADYLLSEYRRTNVYSTLNLAKQAASCGVRRFIYLSSIKVNGESTCSGASFTPDQGVSPQGPYALSKWEAEQGLLEIGRETDLEVVILRPPLVYGPGVKGNFASLIHLLSKGVPLPLGALHNQRSLIALENLIDIIFLCAKYNESPMAKGQIFTVSDGVNISTTQLLAKIAKAYHFHSRLIPIPSGIVRMSLMILGKQLIARRLLDSLVVDNSKLQSLLSWKPKINLEDQLRKMADAANN